MWHKRDAESGCGISMSAGAGISVRIFLDGQCDVEHHGKLAAAERRMLIEFVKNHAAQIEEFWNELH